MIENNLTNEKRNAVNEIMAIRDQIATMGGNHDEFPMIEQILKGLQRGDYTSDEAKKYVFDILERKQDYH